MLSFGEVSELEWVGNQFTKLVKREITRKPGWFYIFKN